MRIFRTEERLDRMPIVCLLGVIAMIAAGCTTTEAGARKAASAKADATQQQKQVKLRYYGGPKYPMYPQ